MCVCAWVWGQTFIHTYTSLCKYYAYVFLNTDKVFFIKIKNEEKNEYFFAESFKLSIESDENFSWLIFIC